MRRQLRWKTHLDANPNAPKPTDRWDINYRSRPLCGTRGRRVVAVHPSEARMVTCQRCRDKHNVALDIQGDR